MKFRSAIAVFTVLLAFVFAQSRTVFTGIPAVKISEGGIERVQDELSGKIAQDFKCVITLKDGKYYWASRKNRRMVMHRTGYYQIFVAVDGVGFVRVIDAAHKKTAATESETETKFDYVEHLLIGLRSVTYYGVRKP